MSELKISKTVALVCGFLAVEQLSADVSVTTADGEGFDGYYRVIDKPDTFHGTFVPSDGSYAKVRQYGPDGSGQARFYIGQVQFDLSGVELTGDDIVGATLTLKSHGNTKGTADWTLAAFTGDDSLLTESTAYDAANPLLSGDFVGSNGDTNLYWAEGAVEELLTFTNVPSGEFNVMGEGSEEMTVLLQGALDGDKKVTFLIYGGSQELFFHTEESPEHQPTLILQEIPEPFFTAGPVEVYQGDSVEMSWYAPPEATDLTLSPGVGDVSGNTASNGLGSLSLPAPTETTTYVLSYNLEGTPVMFEQEVTVLPSYFTVSPTVAIAGYSTVDLEWRVLPNTSEVLLLVGPEEGPFTEVDETSLTSLETGEGQESGWLVYAGENTFKLRYTVDGTTYELVQTIELVDSLFEDSITGSSLNSSLLFAGNPVYTDRSHGWIDVPPVMEGAQYMNVPNDSKDSGDYSVTATLAEDATVFLIVDNRVGDDLGGADPASGQDDPPTLGGGVMDWVAADGWQDTGLDIGNDENGNGSANTSYSVYFRQMTAGTTFTTGAQANGSQRVLYQIAAVAGPVVPYAFAATPNVIDEGGSFELRWTVDPGATVTIDQGVGEVTSSTDAATGVGSLLVTPTATGALDYVLSYTPSGGGGVQTLGPVSVTVIPLTPPAPLVVEALVVDESANEVRVTYPAPEGVTDPGALSDEIQRSATLLANSWETLTGGAFAIADGMVIYTDDTPEEGGRAFYRVVRP
ncbi:hypothetical protein [Roseibacillus ishigakijimensis]|uniref:Uncharacterized protein n=1 Tax=Roseibacillus ishigakijimensis TaxID=454146 RepID=A0A934VMH8_9BACT|nr:hypothetical protein [Roseibacillus ishigakijimensis]MBK1834106.1 hypothetical protein [Roseibacillus ishigakijimensis]